LILAVGTCYATHSLKCWEIKFNTSSNKNYIYNYLV